MANSFENAFDRLHRITADGGFLPPAVMRRFWAVGFSWGCRQIQHLENSAVKGDEIFFYQNVSGFDVVIKAKLKQASDGIIAVKGQPIAI